MRTKEFEVSKVYYVHEWVSGTPGYWTSYNMRSNKAAAVRQAKYIKQSTGAETRVCRVLIQKEIVWRSKVVRKG